MMYGWMSSLLYCAICLFIYLFIYLFICLFIYLFAYLFFGCLHVVLYICFVVHVSVGSLFCGACVCRFIVLWCMCMSVHCFVVHVSVGSLLVGVECSTVYEQPVWLGSGSHYKCLNYIRCLMGNT